MTYEHHGESLLDYSPCQYGRSKMLFRGPKRKTRGNYLSFLGGSEIYGKFIENPLINQVERQMRMPALNFGCVNAGVDAFLGDPEVMRYCRGAKVTVIQITGAQNISNRYYTVHPRRNDRFLAPTNLMQSVFREVDFTEFHFTRHLLTALKTRASDRFNLVQAELRETWLARMQLLLDQITGVKVLLWLANHAPEQDHVRQGLGDDPLFVDRAMIDVLRPSVNSYVEVIPSASARERGTEGMVFSPLEEPAARNMMSVGAHRETAQMLAPVIKELL
ncbi:DUF6473 family protein [Cochlodiniinecator piscidefendens]|uniref:DUF6473 family protein n=1 Tax=Cochlodiniinecator piscidefendens TaxID=2715756 RepID=UPI00140C5FB4|nr:DUF6473 family protein [Cochlodiniinecator piscidefendens]